MAAEDCTVEPNLSFFFSGAEILNQEEFQRSTFTTIFEKFFKDHSKDPVWQRAVYRLSCLLTASELLPPEHRSMIA